MKKKKTILLSLGKHFFLIFTIFTLLAAAIILYGTKDYAKLQTEYMNQSLKAYSAQLAKTTSETYESYENICYSIAYSQIVQDYIASADNEARFQSYKRLSSQLSSTAYLSPYIMDIAVYGNNGAFAALAGTQTDYEPFFESLKSTAFPYSYSGMAEISGKPCHILAMPIYPYKPQTETGDAVTMKGSESGILFLAIDINTLLSNSMDGEDETYEPTIILANDKNKLIYGNKDLFKDLKQADTGRDFFNLKPKYSSTSYSVSSYQISNIGHTLYVLIDKSQVTKQVNNISERLIFGLFVVIALIILLLLMLYRPLIRSLKQLSGFMKRISSGDQRQMKQGIPIYQNRILSQEIYEIYTSFNEMLRETDHLNHTIFDTYTRMYELEANNRDTEIAFLRSQVNPHFLYNTLTMICGMASCDDTDKIISVTGALSSIFRYSIKGSDMVTLREEMAIVDSYLMIQKERFDGRFKVKYEFSEDSYDCIIPKMIIQPLVENAIIHGLENKLEAGTLLLGAGRNPDSGYLAIWVYDNGSGMSKEKLAAIRAQIAAPPTNLSCASDAAGYEKSNGHTSIGISNVNTRIVLYYGANYSLIVDSDEGIGTNVQIRIPYSTREEANT